MARSAQFYLPHGSSGRKAAALICWSPGLREANASGKCNGDDWKPNLLEWTQAGHTEVSCKLLKHTTNCGEKDPEWLR